MKVFCNKLALYYSYVYIKALSPSYSLHGVVYG
jgi:hypothetical protein